MAGVLLGLMFFLFLFSAATELARFPRIHFRMITRTPKGHHIDRPGHLRTVFTRRSM